VITDASGLILRANPAFTQLSGYSAMEVRGRKTNLMRSGRHDDAFYKRLWQTLIQQGHWSGELWNLHRNGQIRLHELQITAVLDGKEQVTNFLCTYRDVTERHSLEQQIRHQATHDPLTNLPNRILLMDRLSHSLAVARREQQKVGLIFIDLNGFKPINDTYGHLAGDLLLQAVAQRMQKCLRESDSLCRLGGDEFVLLIPNAAHLEHLHELAERLQKSLRAPFLEIDKVEVRLSASFGIARWPDHAANADQLLHVADETMYRAKAMASPNIAMAQPPGNGKLSDQPRDPSLLREAEPGSEL
jgi:diguanylate cyclase (GGDEF)-like protein/PAS domain S-box-containing protein